MKHILEWAEKKWYHVCKHFGGKTGITLRMASPRLVDQLAREGNLVIPGIPSRVSVLKGKQIEIRHVFELIICGLLTSKYQGIDNMIISWLRKNFNNSDGNSTYVGFCYPDNDPEPRILYIPHGHVTGFEQRVS